MREGYKDTPIGEIPSNWDVNRLGNVADTFAGGTPKRTNGDYYNGTIPWIKSGEVNNNSIESSEEYITELALLESSAKLIKPNSILVALYGATAGKVGVLKVAACSNQAVLAVTSKIELLSNNFLYHYLKKCTIELLNLCQGSGQPNLSKGIVESVQIPIPPLSEQQKIAEILSTVDDKLDVIDQQISETQALKKGLMQRLLTKGIGRTKFKDSPLGEIPESWEMERLDNICPFIQDGTHFSPKSKEGAFKYITSKNIKFGRLDLSNCSFISKEEHDVIYKKCKVLKGDILLTKDGAKTGNVCINPLDEPFSLLSSVAVLRCNPKLALNQFLFQLILSDNGQKLIQDSMAGQAITRITLAKISAFQFPIPNIQEQNKISEILSSVDEKLELLSDKKTCYQELKQGLMQQLLTGKARVAV